MDRFNQEEQKPRPSEEEFRWAEDYLKSRGIDPRFAPELLKSIGKKHVKFWPTFPLAILIGVGVYCIVRHILKFLLGF